MSEEQFDRAMSREGATLLAWCLVPEEGERKLAIYDLAGGGAEQIAVTQHHESFVLAITDSLLSEGREVGYFDEGTEVVWAEVEGSFRVYDKRGLCLVTEGEELRDAFDRVHPRNSLRRVFNYAEDSNKSRGVKAELGDGSVVVLVFESAWWALYDETYSRDDLLFESAWTVAVGRYLATWADVPFDEEI